MLAEINQRIVNGGIRRQPTLPAGSGVGFRLRLPFKGHCGFAGLGQIFSSGFAIVGLLGSTLKHGWFRFARVRERGF